MCLLRLSHILFSEYPEGPVEAHTVDMLNKYSLRKMRLLRPNDRALNDKSESYRNPREGAGILKEMICSSALFSWLTAVTVRWYERNEENELEIILKASLWVN